MTDSKGRVMKKNSTCSLPKYNGSNLQKMSFKRRLPKKQKFIPKYITKVGSIYRTNRLSNRYSYKTKIFSFYNNFLCLAIACDLRLHF